jgi:hypothetical protein
LRLKVLLNPLFVISLAKQGPVEMLRATATFPSGKHGEDWAFRRYLDMEPLWACGRGRTKRNSAVGIKYYVKELRLSGILFVVGVWREWWEKMPKW